jgi:WD40 repeat protein
VPRAGHTATLLNSGKVLITGGFTPRQLDGDGYLDTAELYDPSTKTFFAISSRMSAVRSGHSATLLKNGKVLIAGGWSNNTIFTDSADLYDPSTNTFTPTGHLNIGRTEHGNLLLPDGRVILAGGFGETLDGSVSMEIYDPSQGTFQRTIDMRYRRNSTMLFLRPDGTILILGGTNWAVNGEIYDPTRNTSIFLTLDLPIMSGAIPISGGRIFSFNYTQGQIVDLSTFSISTYTGASVSGNPILAYMPTGKILLSGSQGGTFDLNQHGFNQVGPILYPRTSHTATTLADGTVLIVGGKQSDFYGTCIPNCELFDPTKPYAGP